MKVPQILCVRVHVCVYSLTLAQTFLELIMYILYSWLDSESLKSSRPSLLRARLIVMSQYTNFFVGNIQSDNSICKVYLSHDYFKIDK